MLEDIDVDGAERREVADVYLHLLAVTTSPDGLGHCQVIFVFTLDQQR